MAARVSWSWISEWLPLRFRQVSGGNASGFSHRSSYELNETADEFEEAFRLPWGLPSWRRRRGKEHSSSKPCRCDSPCPLFCAIVHRRCGWLSWIGRSVPILAHMEVAVGQPETVFDLNVDAAFALQKGNCSDPIPLLDVVLQSRHFLLCYLAEPAVLGRRTLHLCLRDRGSRAIHF